MDRLNINNKRFLIEDSTLLGVREINEKLIISDGSSGIDKYAFTRLLDKLEKPHGFLDLKELELPEGIKKIGDWALGGNIDLEVVKLPSTLEEIGDNAFYYCGIKHYNLPDSLKVIGSNVFSLNTKLEELVIPENVYYLGSNLISGCRNLKRLELFDELRNIGNIAFMIENEIIDDIVYCTKMPEEFVLNYTNYDMLDSLINKMFLSESFRFIPFRVPNFDITLVGPKLNIIETLKIWHKLLIIRVNRVKFVNDYRRIDTEEKVGILKKIKRKDTLR